MKQGKWLWMDNTYRKENKENQRYLGIYAVKYDFDSFQTG